MAPTVLFVPGLWVGASPFSKVSELVASSGIKTETASLVSTGTTSPGNPSMQDDIAAVRKHIESILARGEDVLLVLHSAGGFIGGAAADGLIRHDKGSSGSAVTGAVFLSGAVFPAGHEHQPLPFAVVEGGASNCVRPEKLLFGDLPEVEQKKWVAELSPQPAQGWDGVIPSAPWTNLPSVYVICEKDNVLPVPLQEHLAADAGSKIERVPAGHMPMLGAPQQVSDIIKKTAATVT